VEAGLLEQEHRPTVYRATRLRALLAPSNGADLGVALPRRASARNRYNWRWNPFPNESIGEEVAGIRQFPATAKLLGECARAC